MLELLAEFFCLRTNDLAELVHRRALRETDERGMRRTLSILKEEGYLNRLPYFDLGQQRGGLSYVYGLSDKGAQFARASLDFPFPKTFDEHSARTLDHELEISLFHVALKRLCASRGISLYWKQKDLKCTVNPDALFALTDPS